MAVLTAAILMAGGVRTEAAVIAGYNGALDELTGFIGLNAQVNIWRAPGGGTPITPTTGAYADSSYPEVYGILGSNIASTTAAISGTVATDHFSVTAPIDNAGYVLLAPMFLTNSFVGSFDSANFTDRGAGVSANVSQTRRLTAQVDGSSYFISNAITPVGDVLTPTSWFEWDPATDAVAIGAASTFTGNGNLTAVGYWVMETSIDPGTDTGAIGDANHGVTTIILNGTPIPEPGVPALLLVVATVALARRRR